MPGQQAAAMVKRFAEGIDELGEGPVWAEAEQALYWFDVAGRVLHRRKPGESRTQDWPLARAPGAFAFRKGGGVVFAFRNDLCVADSPSGPFRSIEGHGIDFGRERINDGAVDPAGRFWFGSFEPGVKPGAGALYRLDPDLTVHRMDTGLTMSNGIAWSADHRTMYFADSRPGKIYKYAFSAETGEIGPRRVLLDYTGRAGRPDGCATDANGYLWVAEVEAGHVARYDPDGKLDRTIEVPVSKPTSVAFGGPDLDTLFITSMHLGFSPEQRTREPLAGSIFMAEPGVRGMPDTSFGNGMIS